MPEEDISSILAESYDPLINLRNVAGKVISSFYYENMAQTEMILEYFAASYDPGWGNLRKAYFFLRQFITIGIIITEGKNFF